MSTKSFDQVSKDNFQQEMERGDENSNTGGPSILQHWRNVLETTLASRKTKESEEKSTCIPPTEFNNAWGFGVVTIFKGGMVVSAEVGNGFLFIKLSQYARSRTHAKWIGPIFFSLYGSEIGFNIGATKMDNFFIFRNEESVRNFLIKGEFHFGAATSTIGSNAHSRSVELSQSTDEVIKCYLLESKGIFIGASLQGCILKIDYSKTEKFFGNSVNADDFLSGRVQVPKNSDAEKILSIFECCTSEISSTSSSSDKTDSRQNASIDHNTTAMSNSAENKWEKEKDISPQLETKPEPALIDEIRQKEIVNANSPTTPSSPSLPHEPHHERGPTLHGSGVQLQQWQEAEKTKDGHKDLQQWQDNSATESKNSMTHQKYANERTLKDVDIAKAPVEKTEDA